MMNFGKDWLGREVEFTLLGQKVRGEITEVVRTVCAPRWLVAEFRDGGKQVKVGGAYQSFRLVETEETNDVSEM